MFPQVAFALGVVPLNPHLYLHYRTDGKGRLAIPIQWFVVGEIIEKLNIPKFQYEAEEAQWWDQHREETAQWMEEAAAAGQTTTLANVLERARQRAGTTPTVSIRIAPDDISRARTLAAKKGLRYQTYLKMLLHEALQREERAG
jgi:predicted DNA binding CopG/RHH family protein